MIAASQRTRHVRRHHARVVGLLVVGLTGVVSSVALTALSGVWWWLGLAPAWVCGVLGVAGVMGARHRRRVPRDDAALHALRWPRGWRALAWISPGEGHRDLARRALPVVPRLRSDVRDVVYITWMVPVERVRAALAPEGLELDVRGGRTPISILTYRHGGFGPRLLGPLRPWLCASPLQSNWRLYASPEGRGGPGGIYFFKNALSSVVYLLGARWMSDALAAHKPSRFEHVRGEDGVYRTRMEAGAGSAPDLRSEVRAEGVEAALPEGFGAFASWEAAVAYLVEQNRAVSPRPDLGAWIEAPIAIPIDVASVLAAEALSARSDWLEAQVGPLGPPLVFVVPAVRFEALGERVSPLTPPAAGAR